jgi:hypothetical protein
MRQTRRDIKKVFSNVVGDSVEEGPNEESEVVISPPLKIEAVGDQERQNNYSRFFNYNAPTPNIEGQYKTSYGLFGSS